jgi:hypothetical protein
MNFVIEKNNEWSENDREAEMSKKAGERERGCGVNCQWQHAWWYFLE